MAGIQVRKQCASASLRAPKDGPPPFHGLKQRSGASFCASLRSRNVTILRQMPCKMLAAGHLDLAPGVSSYRKNPSVDTLLREKHVATLGKTNTQTAQKNTHTHTHSHTHTLTLTQTHTHTDTQTHRHTDTQKHRHTDTQTHRHARTHARTHTRTHTHGIFFPSVKEPPAPGPGENLSGRELMPRPA